MSARANGIPLVWSDEAPEFADENEANAILGTIMGRYNEILRQIEHDEFDPIFWGRRKWHPDRCGLQKLAYNIRGVVTLERARRGVKVKSLTGKTAIKLQTAPDLVPHHAANRPLFEVPF